jgi:hypothetical protein
MNMKRFALSILALLVLNLAACAVNESGSVNLAQGTGYEIRKLSSGDEVHYSDDATNVITNSLEDRLLSEADAASFVIIEPKGWAKDNSHVYYAGVLRSDVDVATFEKLTPGEYARDSQHVFYRGDVLANAQPASFVAMSEEYGRDDQHVYHLEKGLANAQPNTFEILPGGYSRDSQQVYRFDSVLPGSQPGSFEIMAEGYARDSQQVYYKDTVLANSNPAAFEILSPTSLLYARDDQQVYLDGQVLAGAQGASFEFLPLISGRLDLVYARDSQRVYLNGVPLAEADPASFQLINPDGTPGDVAVYARDNAHVYRADQLIPGAAPDSFSLLSDGYARDNSQVYLSGKLLAGAQPENFELIKDYSGLARDGQAYFLDAQVIKTCDYASFKPGHTTNQAMELGYIWATDAQCLYVRDVSAPIADPASFQLLGSDAISKYAKDSVQAYWTDTVMSGVDLASFEMLSLQLAQDKDNCYRDGKVTDLAECKK